MEPQRSGTNGNAITSLVLGICGLVVFPPIGILAVIFGNRARREITATGEEGSGLATAGVILGWIGTALTALFVLAVLVFIVALVAVGTT